jgi:site-specific recombinase XerD
MKKNLRTQFIDYMTLNRYSPYTMKNYIGTMKQLAKYHNKSPDLLSAEDIQEFLLHLLQERKIKWGSCNVHLSGLACFYKNFMKWEERKFKLPPRPRARKLPNILSVEEVKRLFEAAENIKHRVLLKTVYSAGLRIGEVVKLKPRHIESDPSRMMIRIENGKGGKDRYAVLSKHLLDELRIYWQECQPLKWLFPGGNQKKHLGYTQARSYFIKAKKKPV